MKLYLAKIHFAIDTEENEIETRQQLEYALNTASAQLMNTLRDASISYKIHEYEEI